MEAKVMTKQEIISTLKAKGYTQVETMAGSLPLDEWHPYGKDTVNYRPGDTPWYGEFISDDKVRDIPKYPTICDGMFLLGVWHFTK